MKAVSLCSKVNHHLLLLPKMVSPRGDSLGDLRRNKGVTGLPGSLLVSTAETHDFTGGLFSQDRWDQTIMPPPPTPPKVPAQPSLESGSLCITDVNSTWPLALHCLLASHYGGAGHTGTFETVPSKDKAWGTSRVGRRGLSCHLITMSLLP